MSFLNVLFAVSCFWLLLNGIVKFLEVFELLQSLISHPFSLWADLVEEHFHRSIGELGDQYHFGILLLVHKEIQSSLCSISNKVFSLLWVVVLCGCFVWSHSNVWFYCAPHLQPVLNSCCSNRTSSAHTSGKKPYQEMWFWVIWCFFFLADPWSKCSNWSTVVLLLCSAGQWCISWNGTCYCWNLVCAYSWILVQ